MKEFNDPKTLWSRSETSRYIRKSIKTVDRLIRDGKIKAFKFNNRSVLIYADSVIEENITSSKPIFNNKI